MLGLGKDNQIESDKSGQSHLTIGVLGAKGGVGTTTFAVNLAASLASAGRDAVLIDTHLQQPDMACLLNLKPRFTLDDLSLRQGQLTRELLDTCITREERLLAGRLGLLSASLDLSRSLSTDIDDVTAIVCEMLSLNSKQNVADQMHLVIDLNRYMDSNLINLLDNLDQIYLVIESTVPCLAAAGRWFTILKDLGVDGSRLTVILNRSGGKVKDVEKHIEGALAGYPLIKVSNAYEAAEAAAVDGIPLVVREPRSAYARDLARIARLCLGVRS